MTDQEWLQQYSALNNSFRHRMIFRIGVDSGFFSEYNNMILSLLYCLHHKIQFVLHSNTANFAFQEGWNDFFLPFGRESRDPFVGRYNVRPYIIENSQENGLKKIIKYSYLIGAYKKLIGVKYFTQDLWHPYRNPEFANTRFTVPELNWHEAGLLDVCRDVIARLWRYSAPSAAIVQEFKSLVKLPDEYISIHVRAGDKSTEVSLTGPDAYVRHAARHSHNRTAFVLTDDYTTVETLRTSYPDWIFYTLCSPQERGYDQKVFARIDKSTKYNHHLRLFAELDIAAAATHFIGTYSSNVGMFMGMRIGQEKCDCLDFDQWLIW